MKSNPSEKPKGYHAVCFTDLSGFDEFMEAHRELFVQADQASWLRDFFKQNPEGEIPAALRKLYVAVKGQDYLENKDKLGRDGWRKYFIYRAKLDIRGWLEQHSVLPKQQRRSYKEIVMPNEFGSPKKLRNVNRVPATDGVQRISYAEVLKTSEGFAENVASKDNINDWPSLPATSSAETIATRRSSYAEVLKSPKRVNNEDLGFDAGAELPTETLDAESSSQDNSSKVSTGIQEITNVKSEVSVICESVCKMDVDQIDTENKSDNMDQDVEESDLLKALEKPFLIVTDDGFQEVLETPNVVDELVVFQMSMLPEAEEQIRNASLLTDKDFDNFVEQRVKDCCIKKGDFEFISDKWLSNFVVNHQLRLLQSAVNAKFPEDQIYAMPDINVGYADDEGKGMRQPGADFIFNYFNYLDLPRSKLNLKVHKHLIFPVRANNIHWFVVVASMEAKQLFIYNSQSGNEIEHQETEAEIMRFLADRSLEEGIVFNHNEWTTAISRMPHQTDGSACGVFIIRFAQTLFGHRVPLGEVHNHFGQQQMQISRKICQYSVLKDVCYLYPKDEELLPNCVDPVWQPSSEPASTPRSGQRTLGEPIVLSETPTSSPKKKKIKLDPKIINPADDSSQVEQEEGKMDESFSALIELVAQSRKVFFYVRAASKKPFHCKLCSTKQATCKTELLFFLHYVRIHHADKSCPVCKQVEPKTHHFSMHKHCANTVQQAIGKLPPLVIPTKAGDVRVLVEVLGDHQGPEFTKSGNPCCRQCKGKGRSTFDTPATYVQHILFKHLSLNCGTCPANLHSRAHHMKRVPYCKDVYMQAAAEKWKIDLTKWNMSPEEKACDNCCVAIPLSDTAYNRLYEIADELHVNCGSSETRKSNKVDGYLCLLCFTMLHCNVINYDKREELSEQCKNEILTGTKYFVENIDVILATHHQPAVVLNLQSRNRMLVTLRFSPKDPDELPCVWAFSWDYQTAKRNHAFLVEVFRQTFKVLGFEAMLFAEDVHVDYKALGSTWEPHAALEVGSMTFVMLQLFSNTDVIIEAEGLVLLTSEDFIDICNEVGFQFEEYRQEVRHRRKIGKTPPPNITDEVYWAHITYIGNIVENLQRFVEEQNLGRRHAAIYLLTLYAWARQDESLMEAQVLMWMGSSLCRAFARNSIVSLPGKSKARQRYDRIRFTIDRCFEAYTNWPSIFSPLHATNRTNYGLDKKLNDDKVEIKRLVPITLTLQHEKFVGTDEAAFLLLF